MKCTKCKKETNQVRTDHKKNIKGTLVSLIPKGEQWCPECVGKNDLKSLKDMNDERQKR